MEETEKSQERTTWSDVLRVIQSSPTSDIQLSRLGGMAQIGPQTRFLELAEGVTLSGDCWSQKFGCKAEALSAVDFFTRRQAARQASGAGGEEVALNLEANSASNRYDCIHWTLDVPCPEQNLIGASQLIRSALNVNGCLLLTIPVRIGLKGSPEACQFYSTYSPAPLMLPQHVTSALEESGFECLAVEFSPNRQTLARYRMIEDAMNRCPEVTDDVKARWNDETRLFLKEGSVSFFPAAVILARRWEYVDGS